MVLPMVMPRIVPRLASSFCAERRACFESPHPHQVPNIRKRSTNSEEGAMMPATIGDYNRGSNQTCFEIFSVTHWISLSLRDLDRTRVNIGTGI